MKQYEFQASSRRLLELMIHSVYTKPEVFLRLIGESCERGYVL